MLNKAPAEFNILVDRIPFFLAKSQTHGCLKQTPLHANEEGFFVAWPGFEPRQTESESVVLPLYYQAV